MTIDRRRERTAFQTHVYDPAIDLRTDVVFVYGWDATFAERVALWRARGYRVHFMTGAAWGRYNEYLDGRFDGHTHYDEAQVARNGERLDHGNAIFYFVPTPGYIAYLKTIVERAIDIGVDAICLEEPEFWARAGYSAAFQALWHEHYGTPWQAPHASPTAWYAAAALKYHAYTACVAAVFQHAKAYAASKGRSIGCHVASHSLINYSQWGIVSPASNLARLTSCDGYVCQVWTGTARTPNHYLSARAERTFATAYLEYGQMVAMVLATGRKVWFLADPIEDDPCYDWDDYQRNYHMTLVASLLYPEVNSYEIMPWPERVFNEVYPRQAPPERQSRISPSYARELLTIANALADMPQADLSASDGLHGIGVCTSDTMSFERGWGEPEQQVLRRPGDVAPPDQIYRLRPGADPEMDSFFGLTLPLLYRGVPIRLVHLENVGMPGYLDAYDVLILSYDAMKPPSPSAHEALATWVRQGGVLVYWGKSESLPFDQVEAWWCQGKQRYDKPFAHLCDLLGVQPGQALQRVERGAILWWDAAADQLAHSLPLASTYVEVVRQAYQASRARWGNWRESKVMMLQRGPYLIAAVLDVPTGQPPVVLKGAFVDLFDGDLPVREAMTLTPGQYYLLYDLNRSSTNGRAILATGRVEREAWSSQGGQVFICTPPHIHGQLLLRLPSSPASVRLRTGNVASPTASVIEPRWEWDDTHRLARVWFDGSPTGVEILVVQKGAPGTP